MHLFTYILGTLSGLSLLSILAGRPWTIILARRGTPPEVWATRLFLETNMIITGAWALLFALGAYLSHAMPPWVSLVVCPAYLLLGRLSPRFGGWYSSKRLKSL